MRLARQVPSAVAEALDWAGDGERTILDAGVGLGGGCNRGGRGIFIRARRRSGSAVHTTGCTARRKPERARADPRTSFHQIVKADPADGFRRPRAFHWEP